MFHRSFSLCGEFIAFALVGSIFVAATPGDATAQSTDLGLDHFLCYDVRGPAGEVPEPVLVLLEDQFDVSVGVLEEVEVGNVMRLFCNPTDKTFAGTTTTILNDDNHLAFYPFRALESVDILGEVKIVNQFGDQKLEVRSADILAVPTRKLEPIVHSDGPKELDHFKCYFARGDDKFQKELLTVGLLDQFSMHETKHRVGEPLLFCNPVDKEVVGGAVTTIVNRDAHLTCYEFKPPKSPVLPSGAIVDEVFIENQFTEGSPWKIGDGNLLCVPTEKIDFKLTVFSLGSVIGD